VSATGRPDTYNCDARLGLALQADFWRNCLVMRQLRRKSELDLYTKNGRPLQVSGDTVYSRSGTVVGRIRGSEVCGPDGRYVGTIVDDRLVHRSTESSGVGPSFTAVNRMGTAQASRASSAILGDEPEIPD
jgi:hypothetical protein